MAKKSKDARQVVSLVSSAGTGYMYYTSRNKRNMEAKASEKKEKNASSKLSIIKYDPKARKHVSFKEKKKA